MPGPNGINKIFRALVMGAYFTLIGCPYITSVELVDISDMLYIGGGLYTLAH